MTKKIMRPSNAYLDADAKKAGTGKINLATGDLYFATEWLHYNRWQAGLNKIEIDDAAGGIKTFYTHCGKGWKLGASQFLVQRTGEQNQDKFTYIDGAGNYNEFTEKYYYLDGKNKNYVNKNEVKVDLNGELTCSVTVLLPQGDGTGNRTSRDPVTGDTPLKPGLSIVDKKVFIERKSTSGFVLETDYTKFRYGQYLETRLQEQIELEEKLSAYVNQLKEYVMIFKHNGSYVQDKKLKDKFNGNSLSEKEFTDFINFNTNIINEKLLLTEPEAMQYNSLLYQQTKEFEDVGKILPLDNDKQKLYELRFELLNLQRDKSAHAIKKYKNEYNELEPDEKEAKREEYNREVRIATLEEAINQFDIGAQSQTINGQIQKIIEQSDKNKEDIQKYFKQYLSFKQQLDNFYLQIPVNFITDGDTVMGFNKNGQLVVTVDAYENQTAIIYDGDKIVSIKDTDGNEIAFEYNKRGLLSKITDQNDKITEFTYENDLLAKIITADGEFTYYFTENAHALLAQVIDCYGNGIYFSYDGSCRVTSVNKDTKIRSVSDEGAETTFSNGGQYTRITYKGERTTVVKKDHKAATTYIFDDLGNPTTVVEGTYDDPGDLTKAVSLEYCDDRQSYSVSENLGEDNLLSDYSSDSLNAVGSTRQRVYRLSTFPGDRTDFVFTCWAKAGSADTSAANQNDKKFELRAVVTCEDGTVSEYKAGFDRANTDWQFLALPVEIKKPLKSGDALPASLPVMTSGGMDLFIDYSGNTGNIEVDCVSLRSGKWTYSTFDEGGRKLTDEDSESNSVTSYVYDENDRLVKQILTDGNGRTFETSFEYNKQGKPVRSCDYSGLVEETVYDDKGRAVKKITYNIDDPTSKFYQESKRDDKGNITADIDECGNYDRKKYIYKDNTSVVVKDGKGNKTSFGYKDGDLVSISGNANGEESTNTLHYTAGVLTKVSNGDTDYNYSYSDYFETSSISIGGKNYITSNRKLLGLDETVKTVYANGNEVSAEINEYDITRRKTTKYSDLTERVSYSYDELHNVKEITVDINNARSYNIQYKRDNGKLMAEKRSGAYALNKSYSYGADGGLNSVSYKAACGLSSYQYPDSAQELTYVFETDGTPDKRNSKVTLPFGVEQKFAYDGLGRTREIALGEKLVKNIYYQKFGDHATNRVSTVWYGVNGIRKDSLKYTYDKAGNITAITENGVVIARYVYDGLNRLICENNYQLSEKIKYGYDSAGNILCKSVNGKKFKYSYPQSGWKDQLLSFNNEMDGINESCEYDALGNPTTYRGRTLVWRGRRLISYGKGAKRATYTYDANSVRTSKTVTDGINTLTSEFIYDGNNLIAERREGKWIYYLYGVDGIAGFRYEGVTYLYRKNIQGDITHIYDIRADGSLIQVAHYAYDAFGNVKELQENSAISKLNPFRYRGYYYDSETKLYYLISRYYDPETGRFISADGIEYLDPETLGGLNLYAYCGNNPVMHTDALGTDWDGFWKIVCNWFKGAGNWINNNIIQPAVNFVKENWDVIVGVALVVVGTVVSVLTFGATTVVAGILFGAVLGGAFGALSAYSRGDNVLMGLLSGIIVGGTGGVNPFAAMLTATGMSMLSDRVNGRTVSKETIVQALINGAVAGVFAAGGDGFAKLMIDGSKELLIKGVASFISSFIFSAYSFVSDAISKLIWR